MFDNVKKFISNPIASIFPRLGQAQEKASNAFKTSFKPKLFGPPDVGGVLDNPLKSFQTKLSSLPAKVDTATQEKLQPQNLKKATNIGPFQVVPKSIAEKGIKAGGEVLKFGSQVAHDLTQTVRSAITPSGQEEFITSLKNTPTTWRDKGFLETLNEPAVITLLTVPDFMTGGGKKELAETALKKVGTEIAENPSFLRRLATRWDDAIEPIINSPLIMSHLRKGRTLVESVPGGKEMMKHLDNIFDRSEISIGQNSLKLKSFFKDLTDEEAQVALNVKEGLATTKDPKILKAVDSLKSVLDDFAQKAKDAGIEVRDISGKKKDFIPLKDYIPHRLDIDKLRADPSLQEKLANYLYETKQIPDIVTDGKSQVGTGLKNAQKFVADLAEGVPVRSAFAELFPNHVLPKRFGNLEFERILDLPADLDGESILVRNKQLIADYISRASKRITQAEILGPNNELVKNFQKDLAKTGGLPYTKEAVDLVKRELGNDLQSVAEIMNQRQLAKVRTFESAVKLSTAAVSNMFQSVNTATSYGVGPTVRAVVGDLMHRPQSEEFAMNAGIAVESALRDMARDTIGTEGKGIMGKIIAPGFKATEVFNRRVAANAGKFFSIDQFNKLLSDANNVEARKALEKFGVDVDRALKTRKLSEADLINSARKAVETSQFTTRVTDLPATWTSSWGKILTQFKNFSYFQGDFVAKQVIKPALEGNYLPLIRYTTLGTLLGEIPADIKAKIRGKERPQDLWPRVWDNMSNATGGLGIVADEWKAMQAGETGIRRWLEGPAVGDAISFVSELYQAGTGNVKPLAKDVTYKIPLVGPYLRSKFFPDQTKSKKVKTYGTGGGPSSPFSTGGVGY